MTAGGGNKFSQVPEWVLDADISDGAFRLYAALLRYAKQETGVAFPARSLLAERLRKTPKSIDRYVKELADIGAVRVNARFENGQQKSNYYTVVTRNPNPGGATQMSPPTDMGGDTDVQVGATPKSPLGGTQMSHRTTPNERHPSNESTASAAHDASEEDTLIQGELVQTEPPAPNLNTGTLIKEWLDSKTTKPPQRVIGHLSREIKSLLDEGYDYALVRQAVIAWDQKALNPSVLASMLYQVQNQRTAKPTTEDRMHDTIAMAAEMQAIHDQQRKAS